VLDRISQVALVVLGLVVLAVLTLVLVVSCRQTAGAGQPTATPTFIIAVPPTPFVTLAPGATGIAVTAAPGATLPPVTSPPGATATPTPGPVATVVPPPTAPLPPGSGLTPGTTVSHTVSRGEWLLQITRCYGAAYSGLRAANALPNPDFIVPGQVINVPAIGSQGRIIGPPCVVAYTVQPGDTWETLAARYATTGAILQRANPGPLAAGRSIWVPRVP